MLDDLCEFTMSPARFTLDRGRLESFLRALPATYEGAPGYWTSVAPAADLPRHMEARRRPEPHVPHSGDPDSATVDLRDGSITIHPGLSLDTWARAQTIILWLFEMGPWHVVLAHPGASGAWEQQDLGIVESARQLFPGALYCDPDVPRFDPQRPTESPPRVGELVTFRRYLGDVDNSYFHTFVRVHSSGAVSCDITSEVEADDLHWVGQLEPALFSLWRDLVSRLDFSQSSPGWEGEFRDRVAIILERAGESEKEKTLDAETPPESFAPLVRLMDGWATELFEGRTPSGLGAAPRRSERTAARLELRSRRSSGRSHRHGSASEILDNINALPYGCGSFATRCRLRVYDGRPGLGKLVDPPRCPALAMIANPRFCMMVSIDENPPS